MIASLVELTPDDRMELERRARSRALRADDVKRARLLLMLDQGATYREIQQALGCGCDYIRLWKARYETEGLAGLHSRHRGRTERTTLSPKMEAKILEWTRRAPTDGSTHWTTRKLGRALKINHMAVARTWKRANIRPHRMRRYMASDDPDFEKKAADVIALYIDPPQHAAVFCLDEKTAIQALDRLDPVLPFSPGRLERHGFEYYRHGTLSLFAALDTRSGKVIGRTTKRHTTEEFVAFLAEVVASETRDREIHIILDNLSTHKTKRVQQFLGEHPNVHLHFTPTYSSWLNQVEIWFSKIERDLIERGVFTSVPDLSRKIRRYIRKYNEAPRPIRWHYRNPRLRITAPGSPVTRH